MLAPRTTLHGFTLLCNWIELLDLSEYLPAFDCQFVVGAWLCRLVHTLILYAVDPAKGLKQQF
jgi:hypothetical protein